MQISQRCGEIPESNSILFNQLVQAMKRSGEDVVNLAIGDTAFSMPMFPFEAIDFNRGYHYSDSRGLLELREKIAGTYAERYHAPVDPQTEMLITVGSKAAIYLALTATLNPGDEVLLPEPAWLSYVEQIKLVGAIPRFVPYDCAVAQYADHMTDQTRMIVLNNPNNPSGRMYTRSELLELYAVCSARGVYLLADEAYSDFTSDGGFHALCSLAPDKRGLITVNSLSKNLGVSGWRIGYLIAEPELVYNAYKLNQHLITCAPTVLQLYLARYYDEMSALAVPQAQEAARKRERIAGEIARARLRCLPGSATFYFMIETEQYAHSSTDLAMQLLLKYRIAVVPGSSYGRSTERFIRISIGTESDARIGEALRTIRRVIDADEYDAAFIEARLQTLGFGEHSA